MLILKVLKSECIIPKHTFPLYFQGALVKFANSSFDFIVYTNL